MADPFSFDAIGQGPIGSGEHEASGGIGGATGDEFGAVDLGNDNGGGGSSGELDSAGTPFDERIHSGGRNGNGEWRKRRGRKSAGASTARVSGKKAGNSASLDALTNTLIIVHAAVSTATKTPELAIEETEAKSLAGAVANVLEEFDIQPDPKVQAIVGLIIAAGSVYGPRMYLIRERQKAQRKTKEKPSEVIPFGPVGGN